MKPHVVKKVILLCGDILILYGSLFLILFFRYGTGFLDKLYGEHILPFSILFLIWIVTNYVIGLYDIRHLRNGLLFQRELGILFVVQAVVALAFFYLIPYFGITPKTNLFLFVFVYVVIQSIWRRGFNRVAAKVDPLGKVVLVGNSAATNELADFIKVNPQFGYQVIFHLKDTESLIDSSSEEWRDAIKRHRATVIVLPREFKKDPVMAKLFLELLGMEVELRDVADFYETVFRRVPLNEIDEEWLLERLSYSSLIYDDAKRAGEFMIALVLQVVLLPIEIVVAALVTATSPGPAIYKQIRVGKQGRQFVLYKFRTMHQNAEKNGPQWAKLNDNRTTSFGKFLRKTHLDELPQLWNVFRGELSLVGPRPERPEFVVKLREQIPYYEVRTFVKPGLTGWAQIHQAADATTEDVKRKLGYDIFYIKNRSAILDASILIRTFKSVFSSPK